MIDAPSHSGAALLAHRLLRYAALVYAAGFLIHTADHLRRGIDVVTPQVFWAGNLSGAVAVAAIALALAGHRLAAVVAVAHGFSQALGVAAVHLLPSWGAFSDSLPDGGADALSWVAVLVEIAGALALGVAGGSVLRRGARPTVARRRPGSADEGPWSATRSISPGNMPDNGSRRPDWRSRPDSLRTSASGQARASTADER